MAHLDIHHFICREDNYGVLIHDHKTGATASIDAPDALAVERALKAKGWQLTHILTTHHHGDHVEGNLALKEMFGCTIIGPRNDGDHSGHRHSSCPAARAYTSAGREVRVIDTPGHTKGHIVYYLPSEHLLFAGDTLFAMGCGRVIEGTLEQMWQSLDKLRALPVHTIVHVGHEYTEANARFALTIEPGNRALAAACRRRGRPARQRRDDLADDDRRGAQDQCVPAARQQGNPRQAGARAGNRCGGLRRNPPPQGFLQVTLAARDIIAALDLKPHPEGGHYRQTWRPMHRPASAPTGTAIYFLLAEGEVSHWHRVDADEIWHWYRGAPLQLSLSPDGAKIETLTLGPDLAAGEQPQIIVARGVWQSAISLGAWTLVGCTVSPGFQFSGFELAPPDWQPGLALLEQHILRGNDGACRDEKAGGGDRPIRRRKARDDEDNVDTRGER